MRIVFIYRKFSFSKYFFIILLLFIKFNPLYLNKEEKSSLPLSVSDYINFTYRERNKELLNSMLIFVTNRKLSFGRRQQRAINRQIYITFNLNYPYIVMTEIIKESLLDKLLKSRYPLTNYLSRQQKFFLATQVETAPISAGKKFIFQ